MSHDKFMFVQVINTCAGLGALAEGRIVCEQLIQSGCEFDVFVGSSLLDIYAKCGSMEDAWRVFNKMPSQNVTTWTAMILGHVNCGQKGLELFQQMQQGVLPISINFMGVLNACATISVLEEGRCVHEWINKSDCEADVFVGKSWLTCISKCGTTEDAWRVFNKTSS
jgi:pentatricopeptide repeat protein